MIAAVKADENSLHIETEQPLAHGSDAADDWMVEEISSARPWKSIVFGSLLAALFLGWTGFWAWAFQQELLQFAAPTRIAELITLWAVPACLIGLCWLLAMRLSATEAGRFRDVALSLRRESEALEARMRTVNGEISLARAFLAENARELESVGRASSKKLTEAAEQLVSALADTDEKAKLLETVSSAAVTNVEMLRNHLPVVTSAAKDTTNQIGNAGNIANEQIRQLVATFREMQSEMQSTTASLEGLEQRTGEVRDNIGAAAHEASSVLGEATSQSETRAKALLSRLTSGISESEQRIGEVAENIGALTESNSQRLDDMVARLGEALQSVREACDTQDERTGAIVDRLDASLAQTQSRIEEIDNAATSRFDTLIARLEANIDACSARLEAVDVNATDRMAKLAFAISALSESSGTLTVNLSGNEERASSLLGETEKLVKALDVISHELGDNIPSAFAALQERFQQGSDAIRTLHGESEALDKQSASITARMAELDTLLESHRASIEALSQDGGDAIDRNRRDVEALAASLKLTQEQINTVAASAEEQLSGSLQRVAEAAIDATNSSKAIIDSELAEIGTRLTEQHKALLAGAIDAQISELGAAVNEAISRNLQLSEEATLRITNQLQSVSDLTANLEQRVNNAREKFDGIDDEAFARRIALLTESLNSAAIDVAKILSNEVTDTAWAAYLKGDRGIFTRRAVRLLDSGEARVIANHYDEDTEFRDHVNRYIHDFESMMRVLLSTRDGNAIGVTLLSSDVGKLYVALAQAIDRLRN